MPAIENMVTLVRVVCYAVLDSVVLNSAILFCFGF